MANKKETTIQSKPTTLNTIEPADITVAESRIHPSAFATYIRALMQNWRQGSVGVKGRSDVRYTGKKPWKQKGTGRARAGDARSPLWRGGGVTFGPQLRDKQLKVPKAVKKKVLNTLLFDFARQGKLITLDWFPAETPSTARAFSELKNVGLVGKKIALFVPPNDVITHASFINIPSVQILFFDQLNAYHAAYADYWVILKKDMDSFTKMVEQWN